MENYVLYLGLLLLGIYICKSTGWFGRQNHATSKFVWKYTHEDGSVSEGSFLVPLGQENQAQSWAEGTVKKELKEGEIYNPSNLTLEEMGEEKLR